MRITKLLLAASLLVPSLTMAAKPPSNRDLQAQIDALALTVSALQDEIALLHAQDDTHTESINSVGSDVDDLQDLLQGVSRKSVEVSDSEGNPMMVDTLEFSGMNIQIVNGLGSTYGDSSHANGAGNLIVGYNESRNNDGCPDNANPNCDRRWGSHMVVLGERNNYQSFGGVVAGDANETSNLFASVYGGYLNTANGLFSTISGGYGNTASGSYSFVSSGNSNIASGDFSSVSGGQSRQAEDAYCILGDNGDTSCSP